MSRRASGRLAARVRRPVAAGCRPSGRPAVTPAEAEALFALLRAHQVDIFYTLTPIEFGMTSERPAP